VINQSQLLTRSLGGPVPELSAEELSEMHDVLDLACGPGGWVLDLAYAAPHLEVAGVGSNASMDVDSAQRGVYERGKT